jgi:hypothetical protein
MVIGLVCLTAFAARAQWWVGGSVSLRYNSTTLNSFTMDDRLVVRIAPEAGYNINAHWAVGMAVGYAYLQHANITVLNQTLPGSGNEVSFKPFARYIFKPLGRCRFYIDAGPAYTLLARNSDSNLNAIGLRANIGIMVDISRRFALTGYLGDIGYQHSWVKVNRMTVRDNEFRFDVVNNFGLGVVIKMYNEKRRTKNDNP